jgi:hypothetical protein
VALIAGMFTYPWDVADEGIEAAVERLAGLAGQNEVLLATSYHVATYFLPHNPKRRLYAGEDGMVLFDPQLRRYQGQRIQPRRSEVVTGPRYYEELVRAIRARGMRLGAWMVFLYNHHLGRAYPECARQDALGNRYPAQLCPANPDVRTYGLTLMAEVLERYEPEAVHLESLSYLPFSYGFQNPKLVMEITPRDQFLLGLCFCEYCVHAADLAGLDGTRLKGAVASHLARSLPRNPTDTDREPVTREWQESVFDGRIGQFLAARVETATGLYEEVAGQCRNAGAAVQDTWPLAGSEVGTGLDPARKRRAGNRFTLGSIQLEETLRQLRRDWPEKQFLLSMEPEDATPELAFRCLALRDEVHGFTFYNYGLLREENLGYIGAARQAWG